MGRSAGFAEEAMSESELNPEAINRWKSGVEKCSKQEEQCMQKP